MADKGATRKPKAKREQASVLGTLPATRPQRLGRPRAGAGAAEEPAATSAQEPRTTRRAAARPRRAPATSRRAKASGEARAAKPAAAAKPAKPAQDSRRTAPSRRPGDARRPAAVRPGVRSLRQQRVGDPPPARTVQAPRGTELVTTTIQAVGELAQIGLTVGGRTLKRAVDRLPRP